MDEDPLLRREWFAVANLADVPDDRPHGVELLGRMVVLWKSGSQVHAWEDLCVHRGTRLSLGRVENGCLRCPYHGWTYNADGRCVRIPAHPELVPPPRAKANVYPCREAYGWIWGAPEEPAAGVPAFPAAGVPHFPEGGRADFRNLVRGPYRVRAQGPRIIENFLEWPISLSCTPGSSAMNGAPRSGSTMSRRPRPGWRPPTSRSGSRTARAQARVRWSSTPTGSRTH